ILVLSPSLTLLCGLAVPPLLWFTRRFQLRVLAAERASREAVGSVNTPLVETRGGAEVIRASGQTRSAERREGQVCDSPCRHGGWPFHKKTKTTNCKNPQH